MSLIAACLAGDEGRVLALLEEGEPVNTRRSDGMTPLRAAIESKHPRIARMLLAQGAAAMDAEEEGMSSHHQPYKLLLPSKTCSRLQPLWAGTGYSPGVRWKQVARAVVNSVGEVRLHIYDLGTDRKMRSFNGAMSLIGGGCFHTAIEIKPFTEGREWSYGYVYEGSGVYHCTAREHKDHRHRETIVLGNTWRTKAQTKEIIERMRASWRGRDYHLVKRNCHTFCDDLCVKLGVPVMPEYVRRFCKIVTGGLDAGNLFLKLVKPFSKTCLSPLSSPRHLKEWPVRSQLDEITSTRDDEPSVSPARLVGKRDSLTLRVRIVGYSDAKGFTEYEIHALTKEGHKPLTARRFSHFVALHSAVHEDLQIPPTFPVEKEAFASLKTSIKQERMLRLNAYLNVAIARSPRPLLPPIAQFLGLVAAQDSSNIER